MIRPPIILRTPTIRQFAASYILDAAPDNCVVLFKENKRTLEQSAKFHAMIGDVAKQVTWYGRLLPADQWKKLFMAALNDAEIIPGITPGTFVPMWKSTTELSVAQGSDFIELIYAFGAQHNVVWGADQSNEG